MYLSICCNGHRAYSAATETRSNECPHCGEFMYRVVGTGELKAEGVNAHDCVREVEVEGLTYCLHARTGFAYTREAVAEVSA